MNPEDAIRWLDAMENDALIAAHHTLSPTVEAEFTKKAKALRLAIDHLSDLTAMKAAR